MQAQNIGRRQSRLPIFCDASAVEPRYVVLTYVEVLVLSKSLAGPGRPS
jgi:hypothetical protein